MPLLRALRVTMVFQDECVDAAVPRDIYEADEIFLLAGADPAKAVPLELASPVVFKHRMPKGFSARRMAVTYEWRGDFDNSEVERTPRAHNRLRNVTHKKPRLSGGFWRADDGTRTHDLLHGKQTL